jgi:hypothetical protein
MVMNRTAIAFLGSVILVGSGTAAGATDQLGGSVADLPPAYDLATIKRAPATAVPGLDSDRRFGASATVLSIGPSAEGPAKASIEWSGYVETGIVFRKNKAK